VNVQRQHPDEPIIPSLRLLSGGGAPKPPEVFYDVKRWLGIPVAHGMGMTEVPMVVQGSPTDTDEQLANTDGKPVRAAEVRIVGEDGSVLGTGAIGELRVRGPMVCKGYTRPELTAEAFDEDGFFRTGDLALVREDGHVVLSGRIKDIIIRKGENIGAKEIEDLLYKHPSVDDVAVIGLPDRDRGERVCAVVQPVAGQPELTFGEMAEYCRAAGLMTQKIPEQLEIVEQLPRNATLKVLKFQLRQELADRPVGGEVGLLDIVGPGPPAGGEVGEDGAENRDHGRHREGDVETVGESGERGLPELG
jgi:cyclohexanecarboxylate-CoA ligase